MKYCLLLSSSFFFFACSTTVKVIVNDQNNATVQSDQFVYPYYNDWFKEHISTFPVSDSLKIKWNWNTTLDSLGSYIVPHHKDIISFSFDSNKLIIENSDNYVANDTGISSDYYFLIKVPRTISEINTQNLKLVKQYTKDSLMIFIPRKHLLKQKEFKVEINF